MVQAFCKKPTPVLASQWTGYNYTELKQFAGAIVSRESATTLIVKVADGLDCRITLGDWIVKDEDGQYGVYSDEPFRKQYESVENSLSRSIDTANIISWLDCIQEGFKTFSNDLKSFLGVVSSSDHCESTVATCRPDYEHLVDVTTSSDIERTGGIRIYRLAPGCEFQNLGSTEWAVYKDGCVFDDTAEREYPAHTLKRYYINYGFGVAQLITPYEPEERFYTLANTCFGIRKSIMTCSIIRTETVDKADYERLSFNGDEYVWRMDGARKMVLPESDKEWNLNFCEDCVYRGDPRV